MSFDNPHAHFHLDIPETDYHYKLTGEVKLYTVENKFWELPVSGRGVNFTDGPSNNITSASDTSLAVGTIFQGIGRFPDSISGVRIPTSHRYVEALVLLALRGPMGISKSIWISDLAYVVSLVDMDRLGHPAFRQLCNLVLNGGGDFKKMIKQGQEALGSRIPKDTH
jgi:hypothetical protein